MTQRLTGEVSAFVRVLIFEPWTIDEAYGSGAVMLRDSALGEPTPIGRSELGEQVTNVMTVFVDYPAVSNLKKNKEGSTTEFRIIPTNC